MNLRELFDQKSKEYIDNRKEELLKQKEANELAMKIATDNARIDIFDKIYNSDKSSERIKLVESERKCDTILDIYVNILRESSIPYKVEEEKRYTNYGEESMFVLYVIKG